MKRVLVTASQRWSERHARGSELREVMRQDFTTLRERWPGEVLRLVQGGARGGDAMAVSLWCELGLGSVEEYPVSWYAPCQPSCRPGHRRGSRGDRSWCPAAGKYRSRLMVRSGVDWCSAFILDASPGATWCAEFADGDDVPTTWYEFWSNRPKWSRRDNLDRIVPLER